MSQATQEIIRLVKAAIDRHEPMFSLNGPIKTSLLMQDGGYKTKALNGDEELLFTGIREGKRDSFVFEFKPIDAKPYKQVEISKDSLLETVGGFEEFLIKALGLDADRDDPNYEPPETWKRAVRQFTDEFDIASQQQVEETYKDNPMWGLF